VTTRQERHDQLTRLDARLVRLRAERPILFNLLAVAVALAALVAARALAFLIHFRP
jgi:hypothetical protein